MSLSDWLKGLAAVCALLLILFWVIGARSRLQAQRKELIQAWRRVLDAQRQRNTHAVALVTHLRKPMPHEVTALFAVVQVHESQGRAAKQSEANPLTEEALSRWKQAEIDMASPLTRLVALADQHRNQTGDTAAALIRRELEASHQHLAYARKQFNALAEGYNAALHEAPTRWLLPVLRLRGVMGV